MLYKFSLAQGDNIRVPNELNNLDNTTLQQALSLCKYIWYSEEFQWKEDIYIWLALHIWFHFVSFFLLANSLRWLCDKQNRLKKAEKRKKWNKGKMAQ